MECTKVLLTENIKSLILSGISKELNYLLSIIYHSIKLGVYSGTAKSSLVVNPVHHFILHYLNWATFILYALYYDFIPKYGKQLHEKKAHRVEITI